MANRQSKFSIWASKNRRDNGFNKDIILDNDLLDKVKTSKDIEYESLRLQIKDSEKIRMKELMYSSKSQVEFLSKLEDEGINIVYLVALEIATEEDIQNYLSLRERGIDTYAKQNLALDKKIDVNYLREMEAIKVDYPNLLNIKGEDIQNTLDKSFFTSPIVEKSVINTKETNEVRNKTLQELPKANLNLESMLEEDDTPILPSSKEEIAEANNWKNIIDKIKETTMIQIEDEDFDTKSDNKYRQIFIVADEFATPDIEGYKFYFVKNIKSLDRFTVNKNNTLIITGNIPTYIQKDFISWLRGLRKIGEKFRIATLQSSPVESSVVDGVLKKLDKEELDNFYDNHKTEDYLGDSTGKFLDLTDLVTNTEHLNEQEGGI